MLNGRVDTSSEPGLEDPLHTAPGISYLLVSTVMSTSFLVQLVVSPELWASFCVSGSLFDFKVGGQNFDGRLPGLDRHLHGIPLPILGAERFDGTGAIIANPLETGADFIKRNYT